jgi:tryptophan-rich sensory protein
VGTAKRALGLAGWLAVSFAAGWIGSRYMPDAWYASLTKPSWTPPGAIFAPVWSVLYVLMGIAAWIVWRLAGFGGAGLALSLFFIQLALNALWSYLFFGRHRPDLAFFDLVALWLVIAVVTVLFWRQDRTAGTLMLPYVVWVGFAGCLNFAIWRAN